MKLSTLLDDEPATTPRSKTRGIIKLLIVLVPAIGGAFASYYSSRGESREETSAAYILLLERTDKLAESITVLREEVLRQRIADLEAERGAEGAEGASERRRSAVRGAGGRTGSRASRAPASQPKPPPVARKPPVLPALDMPDLGLLPRDLEGVRKMAKQKSSMAKPR